MNHPEFQMANSKHGEQTGLFGSWLSDYLGDDYVVYYDHGDNENDPKVAAVKGFYGQQVTNKNRLADIDVIVAKQNDDVLILIEIEESEVPPKKLLGDVFTILFCNNVAVRTNSEQKYFSINSETKLIVAGIVSKRGSGRKKIEEIIEPRLRDFNVPVDAIQLGQIDIVYGNDVEEVLEKLKSEIRKRF